MRIGSIGFREKGNTKGLEKDKCWGSTKMNLEMMVSCAEINGNLKVSYKSDNGAEENIISERMVKRAKVEVNNLENELKIVLAIGNDHNEDIIAKK